MRTTWLQAFTLLGALAVPPSASADGGYPKFNDPIRVYFGGFWPQINSIIGSITEINADVAWQPWRHFGIGAGVRYFKTSVEGANSELNGKFEFQYLGPTVYVHTTF